MGKSVRCQIKGTSSVPNVLVQFETSALDTFFLLLNDISIHSYLIKIGVLFELVILVGCFVVVLGGNFVLLFFLVLDV